MFTCGIFGSGHLRTLERAGRTVDVSMYACMHVAQACGPHQLNHMISAPGRRWGLLSACRARHSSRRLRPVLTLPRDDDHSASCAAREPGRSTRSSGSAPRLPAPAASGNGGAGAVVLGTLHRLARSPNLSTSHEVIVFEPVHSELLRELLLQPCRLLLLLLRLQDLIHTHLRHALLAKVLLLVLLSSGQSREKLASPWAVGRQRTIGPNKTMFSPRMTCSPSGISAYFWCTIMRSQERSSTMFAAVEARGAPRPWGRRTATRGPGCRTHRTNRMIAGCRGFYARHEGQP